MWTPNATILGLKKSSFDRTQEGIRLEKKKIENRQALQVTFSKRKKGLFKKAEQLSLLTGASVLIIAFSPVGEMNIPKAMEDEEHFSLDNIDLEQCTIDELELLLTNLEEEELASGQQLTFPTLEAAPAAVINGVEATQLHNDLEIFLMETEEEENTSSEISPASDDFFNDLSPLDVSDYYLDSFLH
ncbi:MADS-box protein SVP-like [Aristolochia californica]|uniref:MADS-box protein SVP-like n=1 Tax=Aristolochia californica TaxID=171875 RepID=UPI0035DD8997